MRRSIGFIFFFALSTVCFPQRNIQVAVGFNSDHNIPRVVNNSGTVNNLSFQRGYPSITASVLLTTGLSNPKFGFRYGLRLGGSSFISQMNFSRIETVNGQKMTLRHIIINDHKITDIGFPADFYYRPVRLLYAFVGILPAFRADFSKVNRNNLTNLTAEEATAIRRQFRSHISPFGLSCRVGAGIRHKFLGLELSYEQLLTNALRRRFEFEGQSLRTSMRYYTLIFKVVVHLRGHKKPERE